MVVNTQDYDEPETDEVLPGAKKTQFAMKFKLDTDRHLANMNRVSQHF